MTGKEIADAQAMTRESEGYRANLYTDSTGNTTGGYGHNFTAQGLPQALWLLIFNNDWSRAYLQASAYPWFEGLNAPRQAVMVDLCFNLDRRLKEFDLFLMAMEKQNYELASEMLEDSKWFRQVGNRGKRNVQMIRTGQWL